MKQTLTISRRHFIRTAPATGKGSLSEGGTRVACVIIWPGQTETGATSDTLFHSTDFYPTMLAM